MSEETLWLGGQLISTLPGGHVAFMMMVLATAHVTGVEGELTFPGPALDSVIADASVRCHWLQVLHHTLSADPKYSSGLEERAPPTTALGDQLVNLGIWLASLGFIFFHLIESMYVLKSWVPNLFDTQGTSFVEDGFHRLGWEMLSG